MRLVIALGGNALLRRGQPLGVVDQRVNLMLAGAALGELATNHSVVLTHGNGPQVGLLALQNAAFHGVDPYPLDVLGAESEGMIGYLLEQELGHHVPPQHLATLLTQVVVDEHDPAFARPTKPIGPMYTSEEAHELAAVRGWTIAPDGVGWRRVVASPEPQSIVELPSIRVLIDAGITLTCIGGGGIPVVRNRGKGVHGVEAVIDKDLAAAVLACGVGADALILLTDVDGVQRGWGTPEQSRIEHATPAELRAMSLPAGSMGPKVEAACRFVERGGSFAAIGSLSDAVALVERRAGTIVSVGPR